MLLIERYQVGAVGKIGAGDQMSVLGVNQALVRFDLRYGYRLANDQTAARDEELNFLFRRIELRGFVPFHHFVNDDLRGYADDVSRLDEPQEQRGTTGSGKQGGNDNRGIKKYSHFSCTEDRESLSCAFLAMPSGSLSSSK